MKCKNCGNELDGNVCHECGSQIDNDPSVEKNFDTTKLVLKLLNKDKDLRKAFLIGLILISAMIIIVTALYYHYYSSIPTIFSNW